MEKEIEKNSIGHGLSINTIYNMDCIEGMKLIADCSIDAIITDPPYGTTACKRDTVIPFDLMREQLKRIIKPNGAIVLFGSEPFSSALRMSNIKNYKYDWKWEKEKGVGFAIAKYRPMMKFEDIMIFGKGKLNYLPIMEKLDKPYSHILPIPKNNSAQHISSSGLDDKGKRIYKTYTHKYPTNKLEFCRDSIKRNNKSFHPTQKPIALIEYLIKTYTNEGETVLDFTMGSGSTGVGCQNTKRNYIGFELDRGYYEIANKRLEENKKRLDILDFKNNKSDPM